MCETLRSCSKPKLEDLAISGAPPAFAEKLHVGRPNLGNRERLMQRISDMLDRNWLTNDGPYVREFEKRLAEFTGVRHCVAMCNATISLEIAIRALGLTGEVIVPSFTFIATAHALQWQEITPVFCDIDPRTHNIDPAQIERMITPRTTGIIGVHTWGRSCDVDALESLARRRNLQLMFDAAHAFGCSYKGKLIGGFGRCETFSFHATKFFNSFEGGAVLTNDDALAGKMRLMRNFGFQGNDNVIYIGTNGKMTEVCAAMGLTSLESIDEFMAINRRNHHAYRRGLAQLPGVTLMEYDAGEKTNYQYIVLEVDETTARLARDELVSVLHAENVLARRYFYPGCHRMEPYRSYFPHASLVLPETEKLCRRVMVLPNGASANEPAIASICQVIETAVANAPAVRAALAASAASQAAKRSAMAAPSSPVNS
ncbi:MAG TPA: aminotransferase class I/II-fold pyridoxal phosphate-dependent enzyme [Candidatus Dormibacteraeota bacterium]|nr:aminotransferase class I/II-fold pyridoxal phosphate-dependent enzyme [Candidatus Dormibacteraeota bacterium]